MADEPTLSNKAELAVKVAGSTTGGLLSLLGVVLFGPLGALVGSVASPASTDAMRQLTQRVLKRRFTNVQMAADAASAADPTGRTFDQIVEIALEDEPKYELVGRALQAAALTDEERTIRALGRVLAAGVLAEDQARVDESTRIVSCLASLESVDLRVLERMSTGEYWLPRAQEGRKVPGYSEVDPGAEPIIDAIFARLAMQGLITSDDPRWFGPAWRITDFARVCIDVLQQVGAQELSRDEHPTSDGPHA
jgi:hypothetical protein